MGSRSVAIGCGSAWAADRLEPGVALAESGRVDYLAYDCLAERTLALAQLRRRADPAAGHDERLPRIAALLAGYLRRGGRVVGNFGAANVEAGQRAAVDALRAAGAEGVPVGVIHGDDVREAVRRADPELPELGGRRVSELGDRFVSANAYVGAEPIVELLEAGAGLVIGGRLADPSLYVGPLCHELGWALDDWERLGTVVLAGHLLECGGHGAGANYADPPYRVVPDLHDLGAPYAEVGDDVVVTKLPGTGGLIDAMVVKTQLFYEVHDPAAYVTPDAVADFSAVTVEDLGGDRVRARGATAAPRPEQLKVLVGVDLGFNAVGEISFGGPGCRERLELAIDVVRRRLEPHAGEIAEIRYDAHGLDALFGGAAPGAGEPAEVRLRVAARCDSEQAARAVVDEVEFLYFGPAAAGGATKRVERAIGVTSAFLPRADVALTTELVTA